MSQERVMLLIDADNLSLDVMEQTVRLLLNQHGGLHVRRAYCTAESAVANQAAFKRLGIKPMVNLAAGKNSTDIAMAVDAIDLVLAERPDVVVIASSDSDFAPLVHRLREKGCVVRGFGQKGKVGDETQDVYDDYTVIEHRGSSAAKPPARAAAKTARPARTSSARSAAKAAEPAPAPTPDLPVPAPTANKVAAARKTTRGRSAPKPPIAVSEPPPPSTQEAADARSIFEAIVDGALDDEAAVVESGPAAKAPRRTRKTAASATAAEPVVSATAGAKSAAAAAADAAAPPRPVRARGRKAKAEVAAEPAAPVSSPDASADASPASSRVAAPEAPPARAASTARQRTETPADLSTAAGAAPRATLQAVLACLPELARGQSVALNVAVQRLRESRLLGRNSSSSKLFLQFSDSLELFPPRNPSQVRLRP